ncbi:MAG: type II toxin-antitoxin system VapB family antitoxin [Actinomycetota bacterium]
MPLNIRNPEAERLATEVAELTGETKTEAVRKALEDRLAQLRRARSGKSLADELDEIADRFSSLPVDDDRSADEILGYDEDGVPT